MNTVLSYLAGLIALLLVAALAGPTFVDWNRFRGEFEKQAGEITGREVTIGGDISFVVLPAPHLTLNNVSVANLADGDNPDFLRIGKIDVEVALMPLFSGEIRATSVKIARPQLHLEIAKDGSNNWRDLVSLPLIRENGFFTPSSVSLEKVSFEDGLITFNDFHAARQWRVEYINGDVHATSLVGPMRADLALQVNNTPFMLRVDLGRFGNNKAFKITTELQSANAPVKLLFSGISTGFSADARVDGTVSLEAGTGNVKDGAKPQPPLRVEAGVVSNEDKATFRNLVVAMAGTTLKGKAHMNWRARPSFKVQLAGDSLRVDPLLERMSALISGGDVPFGGLVHLPVPSWIDGSGSIKVDGLLAHDVLIRNAVLDFKLADDALTIDRASGDLSGGSKVSLNGTLAQGDAPHFDGELSASSGNLSAFARWFNAQRAPKPATGETSKDAQSKINPDAAKPAAATGPFSFASRVHLAADQLALSNIRAAYAPSVDRNDLTGAFSISAEPQETLKEASDSKAAPVSKTDEKSAPVPTRLVVKADLKIGTFALDPLEAFWPADLTSKDVLKAYDFDVKAKGGKLTYEDHSLNGFSFAGTERAGLLTLQQAHADDLGGASLDFSGQLTGVDRMDIDALTGTLDGKITADKAGAFFALLDASATGLDGSADLAVNFASGRAEDSDAPVDTLTVQGMLGESRVDAVLKRQRDKQDGPASINLIANAVNSDGRLLLRQLGFDANDALKGAGSASLQLSGPQGKPYDTALRVNVGEGTFTARGSLSGRWGAPVFSGKADVSASGIKTVLAALGAPDYLSNFMAAQADGPSFVFSARINADHDKIAFNNAEVVAGKLHLSSDATLAWAQDDKAPMLTGKIDSNRLDLSSLIGEGADAKTPWSPAALDLSPFSLMDGEMDWKVAEIKIGRLNFKDASMHLSLADDVLSAVPVAARMADGNVALSARIEGGVSGEPGIGLTFNLAGGRLDKLGPEVIGAGFATGQINITLRAEAQGRSWLALVSSINGVGQISTSGASLAPLDVAGYAAALKGAKSVGQLDGLVEKVLTQGATPVDGLDGDIAIKSGLAQATRKGMSLKGGKADLAVMIDIPRLSLDSELDVKLDDFADAPGFSDVSSGHLDSVERRVDATALQQFAARRLLAQSVKDAGIKSLPDELRNLMGLSPGADSGTGPSVAGVPVPIARPQPPKAAAQ